MEGLLPDFCDFLFLRKTNVQEKNLGFPRDFQGFKKDFKDFDNTNVFCPKGFTGCLKEKMENTRCFPFRVFEKKT